MTSLKSIQARANCNSPEVDFELFYSPEEGDNERVAKGICNACLVKLECLTFAIDNGERDKIWGGLNSRERRKKRYQHLASSQ